MEITRILTPLTEAQFAAYQGARGNRIVESRGRFWRMRPAGFFQPVHFMARMNMDEIARPARLCWGFRTTLSDADAHLANATLPVHVLSDLESFDISRLKQNRRTRLRKCWKLAELVAPDTPDLLLAQGYEVLLSDHGRNHYGRLPTREEFLETIHQYHQWNFIVLAAMVDGRLGGFAVGYAIGETAYIEDIQIHSDFLPANISTGLIYEMAQVCRRSPGIRELVHGLSTPEKESLSYFKEEVGLRVQRIPSFVWFAPLCARVVHRLKPHAYYRLCGHG